MDRCERRDRGRHATTRRLGRGARRLGLAQAVGERVTKGEDLFQVATDKVEVNVEALDSGILGRILVADGEAADAGQVIAFLASDG